MSIGNHLHANKLINSLALLLVVDKTRRGRSLNPHEEEGTSEALELPPKGGKGVSVCGQRRQRGK